MKNAEAKKGKRGILSWEPHKLARVSLGLALFVLGVFILIGLSGIKIERYPPASKPNFEEVIFLVLIFIFAIPGFVVGIIAMFKIDFGPYRNKGTISAIAGVLLNGCLVLMLILLCLGYCIECYEEVKYGNSKHRRDCYLNLSRLGRAMFFYGNDNNEQYPAADKWCDLIMPYVLDGCAEWHLVCPGALGKGNKRPKCYVIESAEYESDLPPDVEFLYKDEYGYYHYGTKICHYAMNPYCEPNSPPDTVLLFETKGSWNQHGGRELLTAENHEGKGCHVLFNDGSVRYVLPESVGELKWRAKEE